MLAVNWLERFWNSVGIPGNAVVKSTVSTSTKFGLHPVWLTPA